MKNKKLNGLYYGLALFIVFIIIDSSLVAIKFPNHELIYSTTRFLFSLFVVYIFFKTMKTDKLFKNKLRLTKSQIVLSGVLVLISLFIYFILNDGLNQIKIIASKDVLTIFSTLMIALSAGIFEEYLTRGFFFQSFFSVFKKNKLIVSSCLSSFLFGFLHIYNIFYKGVTPTLQQIFYATAIGLLLAALRITFNGLLVTVGLHALIDLQFNLLAPNVNQSNTPWIAILIIFIPIAVVSLATTYSLEKTFVINKSNIR